MGQQDNKDREYLAGRIRELAHKAYQNDFLTHTNFLSVSEIADFHEILRRAGQNPTVRSYEGVPYVLYGGRVTNSVNGADTALETPGDEERQVVCFLPSYLDEETFLLGEQAAPSVVSCIEIAPVNRRFADVLSHRDFLGSLMNLGIERDLIGDILTDETVAYVFVMKDIAEYICKELTRVKHTTVLCKEVLPAECTIVPQFEEVEGSVASERLDAILSMVYHLARGKSQELIEAEQVFVDGRTAYSGGYDLRAGARVSVRGHGKFIYLGAAHETRKGRLFVRVRVYK